MTRLFYIHSQTASRHDISFSLFLVFKQPTASTWFSWFYNASSHTNNIAHSCSAAIVSDQNKSYKNMLLKLQPGWLTSTPLREWVAEVGTAVALSVAALYQREWAERKVDTGDIVKRRCLKKLNVFPNETRLKPCKLFPLLVQLDIKRSATSFRSLIIITVSTKTSEDS